MIFIDNANFQRDIIVIGHLTVKPTDDDLSRRLFDILTEVKERHFKNLGLTIKGTWPSCEGKSKDQ